MPESVQANQNNAFRRYSNDALQSTSRPQGLAVTLKQYDPQARQWRPLTYRSRTLTDTKTRYSQLEKEPKAIEWRVLTNQDLLVRPDRHI